MGMAEVGMVEVPAENFGEMLVFAERYAINRQTGAPDDVARYVEAAARTGALSPAYAAMLASDVREARDDFRHWHASHPDFGDDSGIRAFERVIDAIDDAAASGGR